MAVFDSIKEGDILWDCHKQRAGNTMTTRMACFKVHVISIDREKQSAQCSWNGNPASTYYERRLKKLRRTPIKKKESA